MGLLNSFMSVLPTFAAVADNLKAPGGMWEWLLIKGFGWIKDYGLRIIVFIILLKIILLPIDIFQRYKMRKNQKITERIKPQLEDMQKRYGNDKNMLSQKQMELNKKEGFSYFSSCIPMILTLVIFITLLQGMNNISQYMVFKQYAEWYDVYTETLVVEEEKLGQEYIDLKAAVENNTAQINDSGRRINELRDGILSADDTLSEEIPTLDKIRATDDAETEINKLLKPIDDLLSDGKHEAIKSQLEEYKTLINEYVPLWNELSSLNAMLVGLRAPAIQKAQEAVIAYDKEHSDSFLWIKSIWQPDTTWSTPVFEDEASFRVAVTGYIGDAAAGCGSCNSSKNKTGLPQEQLDEMLSRYDEVTEAIISTNKDMKNGYFILVALVVLLSFFSQWIMQRLQKKSGQFEANGAVGGGSMKIMMFIMPILLGLFAIRYTSAFALYMVTNSAMSILINVITTLIMNGKDKRETVKVETSVNKYGRPDPRDFNK